MSEGARVWITRAEPGASATAARLSALDVSTIVAPLLSVQRLQAPLDLDGVAALAFTSRNAIEAFRAATPVRDLPVFAVGEATARAARAAGFGEVVSADRDVAALAKCIGAARPSGVILHTTGVHQAGDLVGELGRAGLEARSVELYDTPAAESLPTLAAEALRAGGVSAVLFHSPRAGTILRDLAPDLDYSAVRAIGLSDACLDPLAPLGFAKRIAAASPHEDALIDALLVALGKSSRRR